LSTYFESDDAKSVKLTAQRGIGSRTSSSIERADLLEHSNPLLRLPP
jgi:hypothetical protein